MASSGYGATVAGLWAGDLHLLLLEPKFEEIGGEGWGHSACGMWRKKENDIKRGGKCQKDNNYFYSEITN